jgi:hypothetical protein
MIAIYNMRGAAELVAGIMVWFVLVVLLMRCEAVDRTQFLVSSLAGAGTTVALAVVYRWRSDAESARASYWSRWFHFRAGGQVFFIPTWIAGAAVVVFVLSYAFYGAEFSDAAKIKRARAELNDIMWDPGWAAYLASRSASGRERSNREVRFLSDGTIARGDRYLLKDPWGRPYRHGGTSQKETEV